MLIELTFQQYKKTLDGQMTDMTSSSLAEFNIWKYVEKLTKEKIVLDYVLKHQLIEKIYNNQSNTFSQFLLPTGEKNFFVVVIVDLLRESVLGHFKLNLNKEYEN